MSHQDKEVTVEVKSVSKYLGGDLDFLLPQKSELFDEVCSDYIASVSFDNLEEEISVFRNAGWTDEEIEDMYSAACPPRDGGHMRKETNLVRPVKLTLTIRKYRFGLEAKV